MRTIYPSASNISSIASTVGLTFTISPSGPIKNLVGISLTPYKLSDRRVEFIKLSNMVFPVQPIVDNGAFPVDLATLETDIYDHKTVRMPGISSGLIFLNNAATAGFSCLHGPHQLPQKSSRT